ELSVVGIVDGASVANFCSSILSTLIGIAFVVMNSFVGDSVVSLSALIVSTDIVVGENCSNKDSVDFSVVSSIETVIVISLTGASFDSLFIVVNSTGIVVGSAVCCISVCILLEGLVISCNRCSLSTSLTLFSISTILAVVVLGQKLHKSSI